MHNQIDVHLVATEAEDLKIKKNRNEFFKRAVAVLEECRNAVRTSAVRA